MAAPERTVMRFSINNFQALLGRNSAPSSPQPTDTIYYLKTETPHLHDFSVFGPFHLREAIVPSIRQKLQQTSPAGLATFDDLISRMGLSSFEHIVAPLPGGHSMTIRLIKEKNPEVAATLPGPAWYVVSVEQLSLYSSFSEFKSFDICGTYTSAEAANQAARRLAEAKKQEEPGAIHGQDMRDNGTIQCVILSRDNAWGIGVHFDSGVEYFED